MAKSKPQATPDASDSAAPDAPAPSRVHAVHCRGCSNLRPTEHPASEPPPEKITVNCPVCQTETVWRPLGEMDRPEPPAEAESEAAPDESPGPAEDVTEGASPDTPAPAETTAEATGSDETKPAG